MKTRPRFALFFSLALISVAPTFAQPAGDFGPPPFGGGGPRGGGPGFGPNMPEIKLLDRFDANGDKVLRGDERKAALEQVEKDRAEMRNRGGRGGGPGMRGPGGRGGGESSEPAKPGLKLSSTDVKNYPDADLYDPSIIRTLFMEFDSPNWEKEMTAFKNTDVEMPVKVTVDGKVYEDVGVHFRGASSFMMLGEGRKRSLNLSFDFLKENQSLRGYRTLELLNSHDDPTFLRTVLSYQIAREYLPAPKANFVRVVINGESWGIYINKQAFNKDFAKDFFGTTKGARWKAPGSPRGRAGLSYLGDNPADYKSIYEIKSKDDRKSWNDLIRLCKTLNETPADKLAEALAPILDIDGALRFLAVENALINNDGYWVRSSDYSLYQDEKGKFHILPHDSNETFARPGGPGGPGGRGGFGGPGGPQSRPPQDGPPNDQRPPEPRGPQTRGVELDPLIALKDENKPLISKLLAVPSLREKYLGYVRDIAEKWLDWEKLGPIASKYHDLIAVDVKTETHNLYPFESFEKGMLEDIPGRGGGPGGRGTIGLKSFADQRRAYLLKYNAAKE